MSSIRKNYIALLVENYYAVLGIVYCLSTILCSVSIKLSQATALTLVMMVFLLYKLFTKIVIDGNTVPIILYLLYNLITILAYIMTGYPLSLYVTEIVYSVLPIVFAFFAKEVCQDRFYKITFNSLFVILLISMLLHVFMPNFYVQYLLQMGYIFFSSKSSVLINGILGVTVSSLCCACCTVYFFYKLIVDRKIYFACQAIFTFLMMVLMSRRGAILACVITLFFTTLTFFRGKYQSRAFCVTIVALFVLFALSVTYSDIFQETLQRITGVSAAFNERSDDWTDNAPGLNPFNLIFGSGIGSKSHHAQALGYISVNDGSYLKIFFETGIIGSCLFLSVLFNSIMSAFRRWNKDGNNVHISFFILSIFLLQALGSNVFEFQQITPLFWFAVGGCLYSSNVKDYAASCQENEILNLKYSYNKNDLCR